MGGDEPRRNGIAAHMFVGPAAEFHFAGRYIDQIFLLLTGDVLVKQYSCLSIQ